MTKHDEIVFLTKRLEGVHGTMNVSINIVKELENTRLYSVNLLRKGIPDAYFYVTNKYGRVLECAQTEITALRDQLTHERDFQDYQNIIGY